MPGAVSISRPVYERLQERTFTGKVFGAHGVACNLVDAEGDVITLLVPAVGNGPFSILVDADLDGIAVGAAVHARASQLTVGDVTVDLAGARVWEPRPDWSELRAARAHIPAGFAAFDGWASSAIWGGMAHITGADAYTEGTPAFMVRLARGEEAYTRLVVEGLGGRRRDSLVEGTRLLAGLGPGGTPAGDDFLVGVMAAIWLLGDEVDCAAIAEIAAPRTATLSAAFLRAAARGEFIAAWHELVWALAGGDGSRVEAAAMQVESFGASSGADALDGFILAGRTLLA
jgi:hypothetical protein